MSEENSKNDIVTKLLNAENEDFQYAKNNIKNFIEKGDQALNELLEIAQQSQHPRAYEVLQKMIETLVKANQQLIETKKINSEVYRVPTETKKTIHNNLFVGSTAELSKMIEDKRKKDNENT